MNAVNYDPGAVAAVDQGYSEYDNSAYYGQQQMQQQQQNYSTENPYENEALYYEQQQQQQSMESDNQGGYGDWNNPGQTHDAHQQDQQQTSEPGYYYSIAPLMPQQWSTAAPITAIAYDNAYGAVYLASPTFSNGGRPSSTRLKMTKRHDRANYDRCAMLSIHSSNPEDNGMLYASVAGHPEASRDALTGVYSCMYGFTIKSDTNGKITAKAAATTHASKGGRSSSRNNHSQIPSHAYKPVYGRTNGSTPGMNLSSAVVGGTFASGKNTFHMGINTLLPLTGHVASVSPSAVRVHAKGGLQLADSNIEGMLCGTLHPDPSNTTDGQQQQQQREDRTASHIVVGGVMHGANQRHQLHCMDIWRGLQPVTSRKFHDRDHDSSSPGVPLGITALTTSDARNSIVAGCSDGKIRFLDGSLREVAKIRAHVSSVNDIAVSDDGMLIATTGHGYRPTDSTSLYAFPDPNILLFDIRYLGRGGIAHTFSGLNGGPRFLSFIPSVRDNQSANRLLAASGQTAGGVQIIVPFEPSQNDDPADFMLPSLDRGETICSMVISEDKLALGTSQCRVLQYQMAGYNATAHGAAGGFNDFVPPSPTRSPGSVSSVSSPQPKAKQQLELPDYVPPQPQLSLDPKLLQSDNPGTRNGMNDRMKSVFTAYTLVKEPILTTMTSSNTACFGPLTKNALLTPSRRKISSKLIDNAAKSAEGDYLMTVPTASLKLDVLQDHNSKKAMLYRKPVRPAGEQDALPNPNKAIYSQKLAGLCYEEGLNHTHRSANGKSPKGSVSFPQEEETNQGDVPPRYRLTLRPKFKSGANFDHADFNHTGVFPGWDYPPTMPNAFASPVLFLLYFSPALRTAIFSQQYNDHLLPLRSPYDTSMVPELAFLFHQMESLSRVAYSHPTNVQSHGPRVRAWAPSNFLSSLASMKEAEQLQILDGSPAAVDLPRRPEAFYLFMLYQLDKELSKISGSKLLDSIHGTDFLSVNEFIGGSGEVSQSTARALTVELAYDSFQEKGECIRFGQILQKALCKETRLPAWNEKSKSYKTIVQRKIATSLPQTLSLSCACAGRKEEDGLNRWRSTLGAEDHWLPEMIEVELEDSGGVVVRECQQAGSDKWLSFGDSSSIPSPVSKLVLEKRATTSHRKYRYQLDAVLSFVRDDTESDSGASGHHVLHVRVPNAYKHFLLSEQLKEVDGLAKTNWSSSKMFVGEKNLNPEVFQQRAENVKKSLDALNSGEVTSNTSWILANGYSVSDTVIEDARAFHVPFKEPCLVVYRAIDDKGHDSKVGELQLSTSLSPAIPATVMATRSITDGRPTRHVIDINYLAGKGDLVAFDAEFVSVQDERSTLTKSGSKVTHREVRHAVARISLIDCKSRAIIIDDHVLPQEPVVDYLTRFSGIVEKDLDPAQSSHHLISTRSAYLKLRFLMERGCIFVGHGLSQDFLMVNLVVPNQQIIDTVEIFHQERMRYISLRFLANYTLGRDMQRDTHDSVEDALAAYEIYLKALELKKSGTFRKTLSELYEYGRKTDWKLGVEISGK